MIINDNENKIGICFCQHDFFFYLITSAFCVTFRQYELSNVKHKKERKQNVQEHEPVALHRMVSRVLQDDSF
jgi:F0F1-type ATP synthase membrane subunit a